MQWQGFGNCVQGIRISWLKGVLLLALELIQLFAHLFVLLLGLLKAAPQVPNLLLSLWFDVIGNDYSSLEISLKLSPLCWLLLQNKGIVCVVTSILLSFFIQTVQMSQHRAIPAVTVVCCRKNFKPITVCKLNGCDLRFCVPQILNFII